MKRVKCFMLRHQVEGIITTKVYAKVPTEAEMAPVRADLEARHGKMHPKTKEDYWLKPQESVLMVSEEIARSFEPAPEEAPKLPPGVGEPGSGNVGISGPKISGSGVVTNPADQTPEQAKAAAETRARRARETQTITPDDVGTLDVSELAKK